jgi:hypothetical protein
MAFVILIREKLVTIAGMIADVLIMRSVNGVCVRLIAVTEDVTVMRTVGNVAVTVLALVIRDVIILEAVILIVAMVNVTVMRIVSHVMTVAVKKTKNVPLAQPMLIQEVVLTDAVTVL